MKKYKLVKVSLWAIVFILLIFLTILGFDFLNKFDGNPEMLVEYLRSFGIFSAFVLLVFQVLQIFVAIIPGEIIEIVSGMIFPPFTACLICYVGLLFASSFIFFMMRKMGKSFYSVFVSSQKLHTLKFINTERKLKRTIFLLFLIPGTPKDLLTYFFALTPIKFGDFIVITFFARFPSIISSVVGGKFVGDKEYGKAILIFLITSLLGVVGLIVYDKIKNKLKKNINTN